MDKRLAVLFPGIGYHCDKPLLYYSARLAKAAGYEVLPVPYAGFPGQVRGDAEKLRACLDLAQTQAEAMLATVDWAACGDLLFIGKSIGTVDRTIVVGTKHVGRHGLAKAARARDTDVLLLGVQDAVCERKERRLIHVYF